MKAALTAMIATIHHMGFGLDFSMTDPHREDWLRWQGQTPGKLQGLRLESRGTQLGGEDYSGLQVQTAGTRGRARIACGGICMAKIVIPGSGFMPSL